MLSPTIIKLVVKSMTNQPWFTRTGYLSYNESSDWNNVHNLGSPRPSERQLPDPAKLKHSPLYKTAKK